MNQLARRFDYQDLGELATVIAVMGDQVRVRTLHREAIARRAVSCLLAPLPRDEVLLAGTPDGRLFVLAVLERADRAMSEISVPGELRLRAQESVSIASAKFSVRAAEGRMVFGSLAALAGSLVAQIESARFVAESVESICQRLFQTAKRCYRKVTELDQLRAGRLDYRAEQEISLRGENVLAGARKLVKVDGEQIHIG